MAIVVTIWVWLLALFVIGTIAKLRIRARHLRASNLDSPDRTKTGRRFSLSLLRIAPLG
jgi:hypothetical protein